MNMQNRKTRSMELHDTDSQIFSAFAAVLHGEPERETSECPAPDRMIALVERSLPEAEAQSLLSHVALCSRCRREFAETAELLQLSQEVVALETASTPKAGAVPVAMPVIPAAAPAVPKEISRSAERKPSFAETLRHWFAPGTGFALGAAMAGAALFFALTLPARMQRDRFADALRTQQAQMAHTEQEKQSLAQEIAALKKQGGDSALIAAEIERLNAQVKAQNTEIASAVSARATLEQMPVPTAAWRTQTDSGQVRGTGHPPANAPEIAPTAPVSTALTENRPVLECRPIPGATEYRVTLEKEGSQEELPAPKPLAVTRWQVSTPLAPGAVYRWAVTAQSHGKFLHSPFVKFYILSAADKREIADAKQKFAHNPLALGAVYARLGLRDAAVQQFRAALQRSPNDVTAKRWLKESASP